MNKERPSPWALGLGMLDLTQEHARDVKRALPYYCPLPFKVIVGSTILVLGAVLVAMDLARWPALRAWWADELARRGEESNFVKEHLGRCWLAWRGRSR